VRSEDPLRSQPRRRSSKTFTGIAGSPIVPECQAITSGGHMPSLWWCTWRYRAGSVPRRPPNRNARAMPATKPPTCAM
jgi:hypothetical protein